MPTRERSSSGIFFAERRQAADLVGQRQLNEVSLDGPLPIASACRRAAAIDRDDDEAVVCQPLIK
jgi:hypothetical protein